MKVKELITKLQQSDETLEVVLASDAEGNRFHCLASLDDSLVPDCKRTTPQINR